MEGATKQLSDFLRETINCHDDPEVRNDQKAVIIIPHLLEPDGVNASLGSFYAHRIPAGPF